MAMSPIEKDHRRGLNGALAAEIRSELGAQDKTQTWLSDESGIERLTLRRYLKAERGMTTAVVEAVTEALGLDPGELMVRAVVRRDREPATYGPTARPARPDFSSFDDADMAARSEDTEPKRLGDDD